MSLMLVQIDVLESSDFIKIFGVLEMELCKIVKTLG